MGCQHSKVIDDTSSDNNKTLKCQIDDLPDKFSFMNSSKNKTKEKYLDDISYDGEDSIM